MLLLASRLSTMPVSRWVGGWLLTRPGSRWVGGLVQAGKQVPPRQAGTSASQHTARQRQRAAPCDTNPGRLTVAGGELGAQRLGASERATQGGGGQGQGLGLKPSATAEAATADAGLDSTRLPNYP